MKNRLKQLAIIIASFTLFAPQPSVFAENFTEAQIQRHGIRLDAASIKLNEQLENSGRVLNNKDLHTYLKKVVYRINPELSEKFSIMVINSHEPNAWIGSRPVIHITTAMLTLLANEAQLAFVFAHEIAHYTVDDAALLSLQSLEDTQKGATLYYMFSAFSKIGKRSRENETKADKIAINNYLMAGYAPDEVLAFYDLSAQVMAAQKIEEDLLFNNLIQTHPNTKKRKDSINKAIAAYNGKLGIRIGKEDYTRKTRQLWQETIQRSLILRDGSLLRVYLSQNNAQSRYGDKLFYYIAEVFRLGGKEAERKKILPYYLAAIKRLPKFAPSYRAVSRYYWHRNKPKKAKELYRHYLSLVDSPKHDYLGQDLDLLTGRTLAANPKTPRKCEFEIFEFEDGYIQANLPCGWHDKDIYKFGVKVSRDGWRLNQISLTSILNFYAFDGIAEIVVKPEKEQNPITNPYDDELDIVEMRRALAFKMSGSLMRPMGTGFEMINSHRWGWYEYTWLNNHGLRYHGITYLTIVGERLISVDYRAPELFYYQDSLDEFSQTLGSLKIIGQAGSE